MICWKVDECVGYVSVHRGRMPLSEERPRWSEGFSCSNSSLLDSARGELPTTRIQVMRLFRKLSKGQLHTLSKGIEYPYIVCTYHIRYSCNTYVQYYMSASTNTRA